MSSKKNEPYLPMNTILKPVEVTLQEHNCKYCFFSNNTNKCFYCAESRPDGKRVIYKLEVSDEPNA